MLNRCIEVWEHTFVLDLVASSTCLVQCLNVLSVLSRMSCLFVLLMRRLSSHCNCNGELKDVSTITRFTLLESKRWIYIDNDRYVIRQKRG